MRETWGEAPRTAATMPVWAARQAERRAETAPRMIAASQNVEAARVDREEMRRRHAQERRVLTVGEHGADQARRAPERVRPINPRRLAQDARTHAAAARAQADELRSLPVNDAAGRIEAKRASQERQRQRAAERKQQLSETFKHDSRRSDPRIDRPTRSL